MDAGKRARNERNACAASQVADIAERPVPGRSADRCSVPVQRGIQAINIA